MQKQWDSSELGAEVGFVCGRCRWDHPTATLCADLAAEPTEDKAAEPETCHNCGGQGGAYPNGPCWTCGAGC